MVKHGERTRVLITGANRGIGLELAASYIAAGAQVWGSARQARPEALEALQPAGVCQLDLTDEDSIVSGVAAVAADLDGLDLLINCAGLDARAYGADPNARGPFDVDGDAFTEVLRANTTGPMLVTREALPLLRAGNDPLVLNVSSQLGSLEVGATMGNDTVYCVSKAALNMWSVKAAASLRSDGIAIVMIHPGWVSSDMGGSSAPMSPAESASAIAATTAGLSLADSGRFIRWDGTDHPF